MTETHHVFEISLPDTVDKYISNKCTVTQNFGRTERTAGQRKYQELNGMVSRSWQRTQCPSINRTGGNHLENMGFHLHLEKWVDSKCNAYCGIQTIAPKYPELFLSSHYGFQWSLWIFLYRICVRGEDWNTKDPERKIVLQEKRGKRGQEDKIIGQMLNEMEVVERLDWFKELYLKFRGSFGLELEKVKGLQSADWRKV